ncbi:MAG: hypothetical protein IPP01_13165 [Saprospiraceae bacterium]|nr:hypothetical protein [Saprospiraceae bacterium]
MVTFDIYKVHLYLILIKNIVKAKSIFYCSTCGAQSLNGCRCPSCDTWNSYPEELKIVDQIDNPIRTSWKSGNSDQKPKHAIRLDQIQNRNLKRIDTS